jgi:hypothetical protein
MRNTVHALWEFVQLLAIIYGRNSFFQSFDLNPPQRLGLVLCEFFRIVFNHRASTL